MLKDKFGDKIELLMTDTDSFHFLLYCEDMLQELSTLKEYFDFSNFGKEHPLYHSTNKKVPGLMKLEHPSLIMSKFVGLRAKCYCIQFDDKLRLNMNWEESKKEIIVAKGVKSRNKLIFDNFLATLLFGEPTLVEESHLRSEKQQIYRITQTKTALTSKDDKRYCARSTSIKLDNSLYNTLAWGNYKIK